ncbi:hypothetical protein OXPF_01630 [Oxobacter pfennigii]|uniref:DUF1232 domain-containing protein n=1 Tax=Oxobacter pfennigii TaxID=36849 RepID=A0A0P8WER3_9CLOT|nr:DUF1232 domain-containing protein [Oxobacter pfennigii]KPU46244.1 hypothetical protein OXPF_01630 [Oxobacter pfennigii]
MKINEILNGLKKDLPAVFIALSKKETPWQAKILAALTIGYALSPIDLIPDFIPVLGYLDDIIILPLLIALILKMVPKEVMEQCRIESNGLWEKGKPKKWYYSIPVILIWVIIIALIVKAFI